MLKNISNLGSVLTKTEQSQIKGGNHTVTCSFSEEGGWEGSTSTGNNSAINQMVHHCLNSGGTPSISYSR